MQSARVACALYWRRTGGLWVGDFLPCLGHGPQDFDCAACIVMVDRIGVRLVVAESGGALGRSSSRVAPKKLSPSSSPCVDEADRSLAMPMKPEIRHRLIW